MIPAQQVRQAVPRRMRCDMDDLDKYGFTIGCLGRRAKNRMEICVKHSDDCRQRIEEKIRVEDPERCNRTLGRLAEGTLNHGKPKMAESKQEGREA